MILYIHGFNSAPASFKAQLMKMKLESLGRGAEFVCPKLPPSAPRAMAMLEAEIARAGNEELRLVGSSLGGYFATWLAEKYGCKAAVVNPAVRPWELFEGYLGPQKNLYTGEEYVLTHDAVTELHRYDVPAITRPERYLLLAATGDEVLDWRRAADYYAGARQVVVEGSDHAFAEFGEHLDDILTF